MKLLRFFIVILTVNILSATSLCAQRLSDPNSIVWLGSFNTFYLSKKVSLWGEYQLRRVDFVKDPQQQFVRAGVQYHFNKDVSAMVGYAYALTIPYGDYPFGRFSFPEHRIFEQLVWNDNRGRITLNHRIRVEQRYLAKPDQTAATNNIATWGYVNRIRYQLRLNVPLNHTKMQDKTWYVSAYDEIFIGFGKNVNQNVFDQNRIGIVAGYQLNNKVKAEAGFLNQTLQQGGLVGGKQVYQYNNGVLVSLFLTKPYTAKAKTVTK